MKPAHSFELKASDYFDLIFCLQDSVKRNNDFRGVRAGGDGAASGEGQVSHRGQKENSVKKKKHKIKATIRVNIVKIQTRFMVIVASSGSYFWAR